MTFKPGQSGNPGGRRKEKPWQDALRRALHDLDEKTKRKNLEECANALVTAAKSGDVSALKEIGDRLDGKPVQPIAGDDEAPSLNSELTITVVSGRPHSSGSSET